MKITIQRQPFLDVFQLAAAVAPTRSPKTILQNVKLDVSDKQAVISATDQELGVRLQVPEIEVEKPGAAVVSVHRLAMILREVSEDQLTISTTSDKIQIHGQQCRFELASHNPDEFPQVNDFDDKDYYEIKSSSLRELIRRTLFATDVESSRYALGGVLLEPQDETIVAVGTDGRRLAKMEGPIQRVGNPKDHSATVIPARAMQLMERMIPNDDTPIHLAHRANDVVMRDPRGVFFSRLVEGRFPKWREVIPKRTDGKKIEIPVGPLLSALRQAAIVTSEESRGVDFSFGKGTLVLENTTAEVGHSRIEMPVPYDGDDLTISLDHRYVADFLKALSPEKVFTLDIVDAEQAAYCTTDDKYGYVIMPLSKDPR